MVDMNYTKHYNLLIERARNRTITGYTETHHVVPKCMGGTNDGYNLVELTPEEHYVAHQLLVKIYPLNRKLIFAASAMTIDLNGRKNKEYGWLKRLRSLVGHSEETKKKISESSKGKKKKPLTEEHKTKLSTIGKNRVISNSTRKKMSESRKGKTLSNETKAKISKANAGKGRGRKLSEETREKIGKSNTGKKHTVESRKKISEAHKGKTLSDETKRKISEVQKGEKREPRSAETKRKISEANKAKQDVKCPHCNKTGSKGPMLRWHFNKCKNKD